MGKTFYEYLMTQRDPNSSEPIANFAQAAFFDSTFPKQSNDYADLSNYLELNGSYLPSMDIFDAAFRNYQETQGSITK